MTAYVYTINAVEVLYVGRPQDNSDYGFVFFRGIRFFSQLCTQRYEMIGELLGREQHDIALLQEVVILQKKKYYYHLHFLLLHLSESPLHPLSHFGKFSNLLFQLGYFFFSHLNHTGHEPLLRHGDWFGGKAVGLVIVDVSGLKAHVYVTHLHAEYSRAQDEYLPHRIVQSWEVLQFVRHTSCGADLVVLGGDLNMHPQDLGNRLLRSHTGLRDCYTETDTFDGCEDGHTLIADNHFTKKQDLVPFEKGIRIDYILMKGSQRVSMKCESLSTTKGPVADKPFPYSDHEALTAELALLRLEDSRQHGSSDSEYSALFSEQQKQAFHISITNETLCTVGLLGAVCMGLLLSGALLYLLFTTHIKVLKETEDQMMLTSNDLQTKLTGCRLSGSSSFDGSPELQPLSPFKRVDP
uniref:sphingomyelin phosphodiesterase n=1 Tax=Sinocyclocheilus rhinocerous TaxID=307959 RepID=A0A673GJ63_9TELE